MSVLSLSQLGRETLRVSCMCHQVNERNVKKNERAFQCNYSPSHKASRQQAFPVDRHTHTQIKATLQLK